ncbi:protein of unknown function [Mesotoga infera]|uniref:Uncharacterized protein n=1 Tax=Mesotoga infera TaxID=1236046 RepID=A0A7Z7LD59_9BACT|nr:protein of unknown function [Mesotoga infera]
MSLVVMLLYFILRIINMIDTFDSLILKYLKFSKCIHRHLSLSVVYLLRCDRYVCFK